jgi:hypothetical protein
MRTRFPIKKLPAANLRACRTAVTGGVCDAKPRLTSGSTPGAIADLPIGTAKLSDCKSTDPGASIKLESQGGAIDTDSDHRAVETGGGKHTAHV